MSKRRFFWDIDRHSNKIRLTNGFLFFFNKTGMHAKPPLHYLSVALAIICKDS